MTSKFRYFTYFSDPEKSFSNWTYFTPEPSMTRQSYIQKTIDSPEVINIYLFYKKLSNAERNTTKKEGFR